MLRAPTGAMFLPVYRHRNVLLVLVLFGAVILWGSRSQGLCLFNSSHCTAITSMKPPSFTKSPTVDLSLADSPFIGWPLARVCAETTWTPGLVFVCDNNSGGIGNIRSYTLTCMRYAIAAGASGLVMPKIRTRSDADLSDLFKDFLDFDYFFDVAHFRTGLRGACPQITIYKEIDDIPNTRQPFEPERITPRDYGHRGGCDKNDLNRHTDLFGQRFHAWINDTTREFNLQPIDHQNPRVIRFNWGVQWDFPVYKDGPEFVASFGGLLRFRSDILALGKRTAAAMRRFAAAHGATGRTPPFAGLHLRTENDILSNWPRYEAQSTAYLDRTRQMHFKAAYLATGNQTEAAKFGEEAMAKNNMAVVGKYELLKDQPEDLKTLQSFTWDQQALIDMIVLLEADYFLGVNPSSFSMTVAGKRHLKEEGLYTRPWKIGGDGDGRSWIIGNYEGYWDDWLFMYDSLWP